MAARSSWSGCATTSVTYALKKKKFERRVEDLAHNVPPDQVHVATIRTVSWLLIRPPGQPTDLGLGWVGTLRLRSGRGEK